ncbi:MAG: hypothetical protein H7Y11_13420, partial [Armatimonadetes bacterium]|nr:hypothetical protein [Anaerolineae bacterium]
MTLTYAAVALNIPVRGTFDYHIPPELAGDIALGHLVQVAFGTAMQPGIVVALSATSAIAQTKPIMARLHPEPVLTAQQIALAHWMSGRYLAPTGMCCWLWLPPGLVGYSDTLLTLLDADAAPADGLQARILAVLAKRSRLRLRQLQQSLGEDTLAPAVKALVSAGSITAEPILA